MFLSKHSNGTYYIIYEKPNGKRGTKTTGERLKSKAIKKLHKFQVQFEEEQSRKVIPIKFKLFFFNFLRSSEPYYTDKTVNVYKTTFNIALKYFGDVYLTSITTQLIEDYLLMRVKHTSVYAARKDLSNLSCAFNRAVRDGYLIQNPCKGIRRFRIPERQPSFYTKEEFVKLLNAIDNEDIRDLVKVAVNTGLRQGELISLEWNQIDLERGLINLDNKNHITKTKRVRALPINNPVKEVLNNRINHRSQEHNYIFTFNNEPIEQKFLTRYFKQFIYKAKVNPKLNFHSLRHTFASWLVQAGVSIYVVSKLLGHSDIKTTQIYSHLSTENFRNAVDVLTMN
jgi:integrase